MGMGNKRVPSAPVAGVYLLGVAIAVLAVAQVSLASSAAPVRVVEFVFPMASAAIVVYGGYTIQRQERARIRGRRVLLSAALLVVAGELVVGMDYLTNSLANEPTSNVAFPAVAVFAVASAISLPVGFYYDEAITKREELRQELGRAQRLNDQLDTVNQRLLVMNRVVRHNLRTELTLLIGYHELFLDRATDQEAREMLTECRESIDNLTDIERKTTYIDRLGKAERADVESGACDVADLVERVAESTRSRASEVTVDVDAVAEAYVPDHPLLQTVLSELVGNATAHNDTDGLCVHLSVTRPAADAVEVVVADTGSGIPDQELDALENGEETPLDHASGIGLWLVTWVVSEMDGTVSFEENAPTGARVVMRFPSREPEQMGAAPSGRS